MKLSEIKDISAEQKQALEKQEKGLKRRILPELPDMNPLRITLKKAVSLNI